MSNNNTLRVWDPGVRLFHWSLVSAFIVAYLSGEMHDLHTWTGYTLIGLLAFRLVWGFVGSRHARFSDFLYSPREVLGYLRGIARGRPPHYLGHNPAGGWMILLMLLTLVLISYSGLKALALEGEGPFANGRFSLIASAYAHGGETHPKPRDDETAGTAPEASAAPRERAVPPGGAAEANGTVQNERFWSEVHAVLVNIMLALIAIHLAGVFVSSLLHRENLVRAMITGEKQRDAD